MLEALERTASEERFTVAELVKYRDRDDYDLIAQRGEVWNLSEKSDLIHSLASLYDIGNFYINIVDGKYRVMDGLQRRTTIIHYLLNQFKLNDDVESVLITTNISTGEKKKFDLAGKLFKELDIEMQDIIKNRMLTNKTYNNLSIERESIIIKKINSGRSFTDIEKTVMETFDHVQPFVVKALEHKFFTKIKLSSVALKAKALDSTVHRMISIELGLPKSFTPNALKRLMIEVDKFKSIDEEMEDNIFKKLDYLDKAFPETPSECLGKNNTLLAYIMSEMAIEDKCSPLEFGGIIQSFANENGRGIDNPSLRIIKEEIKKMENYYDNHKDKELEYKLKPPRVRTRKR